MKIQIIKKGSAKIKMITCPYVMDEPQDKKG
jgi:hypothetical protein